MILWGVWVKMFEQNTPQLAEKDQVVADMYNKSTRKERECAMGRDGEECGTLSLGDRPGQLRGWNVPEKYAPYSWRTGNKARSFALSLSTSPPFPLGPHYFTLNSAACLFTFISLSGTLLLCLCVFLPLPPPSPGLWGIFFVHLPSA